MSSWPCPEPAFIWDRARQHWTGCTACGRFAWEHEQADPLADMYKTARMWRDGDDPSQYPPTMKPDPED